MNKAKYPWMRPLAVEIFAGKYEPSKPELGFFNRFVPASDHRNWDTIRAWVIALSVQLYCGEALQSA